MALYRYKVELGKGKNFLVHHSAFKSNSVDEATHTSQFLGRCVIDATENY